MATAQEKLNTANKNLNNLGTFKYSDSTGLQSAYNGAYKDYNDWIENPNKYGYNKYQSDVDKLFNQVMSQEKFSYDPQQDKLFQMYKQQYQAQGQRAMQNQMGVAAARSGGYNSSAAQSAAQSTYQGYMDALSEKAAETYQNSLDMYKYNQQQLLNRYNTARDMNNAGNEAYWKQADAKAQKMNNTYSVFNDDRSYQWNKYSDNRNFLQTQVKNAQDQVNWQKEYELQKRQVNGG